MKNLRFFLPAVALSLVMTTAVNARNLSGDTAKIALKILYVGYDPQKPMPAKLVWYMPSEKRYKEFYKSRMPAFSSFLSKKFTDVRTVDGRDYDVKMSEAVDVTIFDAYPVKLPADFSRPAILLGAVAPDIGIPIGLKFDWYCQCLQSDALNIKTDHEIFNTPDKVKLTMVRRPTPGGFFNGFQGATTPATMPMWRVVTEGGPGQHEPYLIGMVAHGEGFADSPDAEIISGGDCLKNAEAVALGRHGNYFMWGFAGSPDFMTAEANRVFVNTICYIKKFDRKVTIVKKIQQATREEINEKIYRADEELYKRNLITGKAANEHLKEMQQALRDKKAAGVDIGKGNEMFLKMPLASNAQSFEDYLTDWEGPELVKQFGTDTRLYRKYFKDNYEYFYPLGFQSLQLDETALQLGISNRSPLMLEKCIERLETDVQDQLARTLLGRYTTEKFSTAEEWRSWFEKNKDNLFYTETGGFKFMVNTYDKTGRNSDAPAIIFPAFISPPEAGGPAMTDPVSVTARVVYEKSNKTAIVIIEARILKGWHIYAYLPENTPYIQAVPSVQLPAGVKYSQGGWKSSAGERFPGHEDMFIYENRVVFSTQLDIGTYKPGSIITCSLYYQPCDDKKCLEPQRKLIALKM